MTTSPTTLESTAPRSGPHLDAADVRVGTVVRSGAVAAAVAATATTVAAALARAAGVDLDVDREPIPLGAFATSTLLAAAVGVLIAVLLRRRREIFVAVCTALTALSFVPAVVAPEDVAGRATLVAIHLLAAVIVIPLLGRRLDPRR